MVVVLALSVAGCGKSLPQSEITKIGNNAVYSGSTYGMGKSCNLPEAEAYDTAYRNYLKSSLGMPNLVSYTKILRVYELAANHAASKPYSQDQCLAFKQGITDMTELYKKEAK